MCFTHEILNISDSFPILTTKIFIQAVAACSRILNFMSEDVLLTFPILTTCVCSFYTRGVRFIIERSIPSEGICDLTDFCFLVFLPHLFIVHEY